MKEVLISAVMSIYNDEKRVTRAIESVKRQTFQKWELLCIDDGSTDRTPEILDALAISDSRIHVFHMSENGGLGKARNFAMDKVLGKYLMFVDSDDYIKEECFMTLFDLAEETGSEDVYFGLESTYEDELVALKNISATKCRYFGENKEYTCYQEGIRFLHEMIQNNQLSFSGCRQFYLMDYLNQYRIRFPEDIYSEDVPFTVEVMMHCSKLCYLRKELYVYCHRQNSITTKRFDADRLYSAFRICMIFFHFWYENKPGTEPFTEVMSYLYQYFIAYSRNIYTRLLCKERQAAKEKISADAHNLEMYQLLIEECLPGLYVQQVSEEKLGMIREYGYVIIYGAGNYAADIYMILKKQYINIAGFAVTKFDDNTFPIDEKPIKAIEDWMEYRDRALVIIGTAKSSEEKIRKRLMELEFKHILSL